MAVRNVGRPVANPPESSIVAHPRAVAGQQRGRKAERVGNGEWIKLACAACAVAIGGVALYYYLGRQNPVSLRRSLTVFPEHTARYMYPGIQLVAEGALGCAYGEYNAMPLPKALCEAEAIRVDHVLQARGMKVCTPATSRNGLFAETGEGRFLTCLDPQKLIDYEKALEVAEKEVLIKPGFFEKPAAEIAEFFKGIHRLIMQSEPDQNPGSYRKETAFVFDGSIPLNSDQNTMFAAFRNAGATESQIQTLRGALRKSSYDDFTPEERSVYELIGFFPPAADKVSEMMESFYAALKTQVATCTDPIDLAADAHCQQSSIHAFRDGNGRLARFLMNLLLAFFKQPTLGFPDDKSYMNAVIANAKAPGSFATYLKEIVIPWNKKLQNP